MNHSRLASLVLCSLVPLAVACSDDSKTDGGGGGTSTSTTSSGGAPGTTATTGSGTTSNGGSTSSAGGAGGGSSSSTGGITTTYKEISVGDGFACGVTEAGAAKCWGANDSGQLGDGTNTASSSPVDVKNLTGVDSISVGHGVGASFACALAGGVVSCWGKNDKGQLGSGSTDASSSTPIEIAGLGAGVVAVSSGGTFSCALNAARGVMCWGEGTDGQLGDGLSKSGSTPVQVKDLTADLLEISAGEASSCAINAAGGLKCWGRNTNGVVGDGSTTTRPTPVTATGLSSNVNAVSVGTDATCAVNSAGAVLCWGVNTAIVPGGSTSPTATTLVNGIAKASVGSKSACVVGSNHSIKCWGANDAGELGDGTNTSTTAPSDFVTGLDTDASLVATGTEAACAITEANVAECWGKNDKGQLGNGKTDSSNVPVEVGN